MLSLVYHYHTLFVAVEGNHFLYLIELHGISIAVFMSGHDIGKCLAKNNVQAFGDTQMVTKFPFAPEPAAAVVVHHMHT